MTKLRNNFEINVKKKIHCKEIQLFWKKLKKIFKFSQKYKKS